MTNNRRGDYEREDRALRGQGREMRGSNGGKKYKILLILSYEKPRFKYTHAHIHMLTPMT